MLLLIELSRLRIESFFALPFCFYHIMGSWVGIRVMIRESFQIFFASPERYIVTIVTWSSKGHALKYCSMSQRSSSLGILNPVEWLWFRGSNASGVARWDIRFTNRKPISTASSPIWPDPSRFGHRHRDRWGPMKMALLHWEDAVLISERLVTNDSWFSCLFAIVYTCPSKWSTLPSSWVTRSLSVSLTTAAADSSPLLSSSLDMVQQEEN